MPCHRHDEIIRNIRAHMLADYRNDEISRLHLASRALWEAGLEIHIADCTVCQKENGKHAGKQIEAGGLA